MIIITDITRLPDEDTHVFLVRDVNEAQKKSTQYQSSWFYRSKYMPNTAYLYVLNFEWEAKQKEKNNV